MNQILQRGGLRAPWGRPSVGRFGSYEPNVLWGCCFFFTCPRMTHSLVLRVTPALVTGEGRAFDEPTKLWAVRRSRREPLSHGRERLVEVELAERALTAVWVELEGRVQ